MPEDLIPFLTGGSRQGQVIDPTTDGRILRPREETPAPRGFVEEATVGFERGVRNLQSTSFGFGSLVADVLGAESTRDRFVLKAREIERQAAKLRPTVDEFTAIQSSRDAASWVVGTLAEFAPQIAEFAVTATAGALIGSSVGPEGTFAGGLAGIFGKQALKGYIKSETKRFMKQGMTQQVARRLAMKNVAKAGRSIVTKELGQRLARQTGAGFGLAAGVFPIEAGANYLETLAETGKHNPYSAAMVGAAQTGIEFLGGGWSLFKKIMGKNADVGVRLLGGFILNAAQQMPAEFGQEATQEFLGQLNTWFNDTSTPLADKQRLLRYFNAGMAGATVGGFFATIGTVADVINSEPGTAESNEAFANIDEFLELDPDELTAKMTEASNNEDDLIALYGKMALRHVEEGNPDKAREFAQRIRHRLGLSPQEKQEAKQEKEDAEALAKAEEELRDEADAEASLNFFAEEEQQGFLFELSPAEAALDKEATEAEKEAGKEEGAKQEPLLTPPQQELFKPSGEAAVRPPKRRKGERPRVFTAPKTPLEATDRLVKAVEDTRSNLSSGFDPRTGKPKTSLVRKRRSQPDEQIISVKPNKKSPGGIRVTIHSRPFFSVEPRGKKGNRSGIGREHVQSLRKFIDNLLNQGFDVGLSFERGAEKDARTNKPNVVPIIRSIRVAANPKTARLVVKNNFDLETAPKTLKVQRLSGFKTFRDLFQKSGIRPTELGKAVAKGKEAKQVAIETKERRVRSAIEELTPAEFVGFKEALPARIQQSKTIRARNLLKRLKAKKISTEDAAVEFDLNPNDVNRLALQGVKAIKTAAPPVPKKAAPKKKAAKKAAPSPESTKAKVDKILSTVIEPAPYPTDVPVEPTDKSTVITTELDDTIDARTAKAEGEEYDLTPEFGNELALKILMDTGMDADTAAELIQRGDQSEIAAVFKTPVEKDVKARVAEVDTEEAFTGVVKRSKADEEEINRLEAEQEADDTIEVFEEGDVTDELDFTERAEADEYNTGFEVMSDEFEGRAREDAEGLDTDLDIVDAEGKPIKKPLIEDIGDVDLEKGQVKRGRSLTNARIGKLLKGIGVKNVKRVTVTDMPERLQDTFKVSGDVLRMDINENTIWLALDSQVVAYLDGTPARGASVVLNRDAVMWLSKGLADEQTFHHEWFHLAKRLMLTQEEINKMDAAKSEEAQAREYANWDGHSKTSLYRKIRRFFTRMLYLMTFRDLPAQEQLFRQISTDKLMAQRAKGDALSVQEKSGITQEPIHTALAAMVMRAETALKNGHTFKTFRNVMERDFGTAKVFPYLDVAWEVGRANHVRRTGQLVILENFGNPNKKAVKKFRKRKIEYLASLTQAEQAVLVAQSEKLEAAETQAEREKLDTATQGSLGRAFSLVEPIFMAADKIVGAPIFSNILFSASKAETLSKRFLDNAFRKVTKATKGLNRVRLGVYAALLDTPAIRPILLEQGGRIAKVVESLGTAEEFDANVSAEEKNAIATARIYFDIALDAVNSARIQLGHKPIKRKLNYFTFSRLENALHQDSLNVLQATDNQIRIAFTKDPVLGIIGGKKRKLDPKAVKKLFPFLHRDADNIKPIDFDFNKVFAVYMNKAGRYAFFAPIVTKAAEMIQPSMYKNTKGEKVEYGGLGVNMRNTALLLQTLIDKWMNVPTEFQKNYRGIENIARFLSTNIATYTLGFSFRSVFVQPTAAVLTASWIGPGWMGRGAIDFFDPKMRAMALRESFHLSSRMPDVEFENLQSVIADGTLAKSNQKIRQYGFAMLQKTDQITAIISWLGAYKRLREADGLNHKDAVRQADRIIRLTHGSASKTFRSPIQRTATGRALTLFQTFTIGEFNYITREVLGIAKSSKLTSPSGKSLEGRAGQKEMLARIATLLLAGMVINSLFEDFFGMDSPIPSPFRAFLRGIAADEGPFISSWRAGMEFVGQVPLVGGVQYGSTLFGAAGGLIDDTLQVASFGKGIKKSPIELGAKLLGVTGGNQIKKTYKAFAAEANPVDAILGNYREDRRILIQWLAGSI